MPEEKAFQLPELDPDIHPATELFAQTVASLVTDSDTMKKRIGRIELDRAIAYVDNTAKRTHNANGDDALSPERAAGQITTVFGGLLDRYWDMGVAVRAVHGGELHVQTRDLLFAQTAQTQQRH